LVRPGESVVVGRDRSCELVVPDKSVSRRHARVQHTDGEWQVQDLGSRNGIHQNGRRSDVITITDGAEVRIGSPYDGPILTFALRPATAVEDDAPAPATDAPAAASGQPAAASGQPAATADEATPAGDEAAPAAAVDA